MYNQFKVIALKINHLSVEFTQQLSAMEHQYANTLIYF